MSDSDLPRSPKRRFNFQILAAVAAIAVLLIGGVAGYMLTQESQDIRQQANPPSDGLDEDEGAAGDNENEICGGDGEKCCDPKNASVCDGSLYCNTGSGKCQADVPGGICDGKQGSKGQLDPNKCIVCECGNQCNLSGECTLNCRADQDCNAATQVLISGNTCGQVDFQDTNKAYCGVKAIKCDGSCAGGGGGGSGVQCEAVTGRVGQPGPEAVTVAPRIGDEFFLKCRPITGASSYKFRYFYTKKRSLESLVGRKAVRVFSREGNLSASQPIAIEKVGLYYGQCRVCLPDASRPSGQRCSAWESTQNNANRLPFQDGGPFGTQADPTDATIAGFDDSGVDSADGVPEGIIPALQPLSEYGKDTSSDKQNVDQPVTE